MYEVIKDIIGFSISEVPTYEEQLILQVCCIVIVILLVTFIDLFYRVFRHFWR